MLNHSNSTKERKLEEISMKCATLWFNMAPNKQTTSTTHTSSGLTGLNEVASLDWTSENNIFNQPISTRLWKRKVTLSLDCPISEDDEATKVHNLVWQTGEQAIALVDKWTKESRLVKPEECSKLNEDHKEGKYYPLPRQKV